MGWIPTDDLVAEIHGFRESGIAAARKGFRAAAFFRIALEGATFPVFATLPGLLTDGATVADLADRLNTIPGDEADRALRVLFSSALECGLPTHHLIEGPWKNRQGRYKVLPLGNRVDGYIARHR